MSTDIMLTIPDQDDPIDDRCSPLFENPRTVAILDINGIRIPLSMIRLENLITQVKEFDEKIFCYKCEQFIMSRSGWNYGGSCKLKGKEYNISIAEENAGYDCCVDCMDTCKEATIKNIEVK